MFSFWAGCTVDSRVAMRRQWQGRESLYVIVGVALPGLDLLHCRQLVVWFDIIGRKSLVVIGVTSPGVDSLHCHQLVVWFDIIGVRLILPSWDIATPTIVMVAMFIQNHG
jgi:hypothetical protein